MKLAVVLLSVSIVVGCSSPTASSSVAVTGVTVSLASATLTVGATKQFIVDPVVNT